AVLAAGFFLSSSAGAGLALVAGFLAVMQVLLGFARSIQKCSSHRSRPGRVFKPAGQGAVAFVARCHSNVEQGTGRGANKLA
ncbi:hypothetical protein ABTO93_19435, partial [Acinetobacter baumannii]